MVRGEFRVGMLCSVLSLRRSSFYHQVRERDELALREVVESVALEFPRYGYRRMTAELGRRGYSVNHKRILRLMREASLLVEAKRFCRTTFSEEEVYLNEYRDFDDAYRHIAQFLDDVYMYKRIHSALGYHPPTEFEAQWQARATDISAEPIDPLEIYRTADRPLRRPYTHGAKHST